MMAQYETTKTYGDLTQVLAQRMTELTGGEWDEYVKLSEYFAKHGKRITPSSFGAYTRGANLPYCDSLVLIAKHYGVSTDWLLGLSDVKRVGGAQDKTVNDYEAARLRDAIIQAATIMLDALPSK
jgi:hypothetical protein